MASKKPKIGSKKDSKTEDPPKFLLVQTDESDQDNKRLEGEQMNDDATSDHEVVNFTGASASSADGDADGDEKENWRDRDDIRDGLMDHVQERFGIDKDVAEKAINDILRIA